MTAPAIVDPRTGEVVTMPELNVRMVRLMDELESSAAHLDAKLKELGTVTFTYDVLFAASVISSDARSEDRRKAEALGACDAKPYRPGESLAHAKARLEVEVRALRDAQHNLRSILSGLQSLGSNLRAEASTGGWQP